MGLFGTPKTNNNLIGKDAEDLALQFLLNKGMRLVDRNYRCKAGEIDLIMQQKNNELVFVEVRYRKNVNFGSGAESVNYQKQQKIIKTAEYYLQHHPMYSALPCRIDVISISAHDKQARQHAHVDWIPNAIQA